MERLDSIGHLLPYTVHEPFNEPIGFLFSSLFVQSWHNCFFQEADSLALHEAHFFDLPKGSEIQTPFPLLS